LTGFTGWTGCFCLPGRQAERFNPLHANKRFSKVMAYLRLHGVLSERSERGIKKNWFLKIVGSHDKESAVLDTLFF